MCVSVVLQAAPKRIGSGRSKRNMDEGVKLVKVGQKILEDSARLSGVNPKLSSASKGGNQSGRKSSSALAVPAGCTGDTGVGGVDERVARRTAKADPDQVPSVEDGESPWCMMNFVDCKLCATMLFYMYTRLMC
jgi:hypothetical protein